MQDIRISRRALMGTASVAATAGDLPLKAQTAARRPNVLFPLADEMGYADLGCYGSRHIPAGTQSDQFAATMDFYSAILDAPVADYSHMTLDGMSMLANGETVDRTLSWNFQGHDQAAELRRNRKYYRIEGNEFFYDLSRDGHERANHKDEEANSSPSCVRPEMPGLPPWPRETGCRAIAEIPPGKLWNCRAAKISTDRIIATRVTDCTAQKLHLPPCMVSQSSGLPC